MNEGRDITGENLSLSRLSCNAKSPHATWTVMNVGDLSILFSYGQPVGFRTPAVTLVRDRVKRATQKHLNAWQDFRQHVTTSPEEFDRKLIVALESEVARISTELWLTPSPEKHDNG